MTIDAPLSPTPLVALEGVLVKLECSNPGGSVKDRIARFLLDAARERGELRPGDTIVEATSGNTGIAMAMAGRAAGHPVVIYMPEHMSEERVRFMEAFGAEVRLTPRDESFAGSIERRDAFRGRLGYYVPDQFGNPDNVRCHESTTGPEILAQVRELGVARLDAFVAGVGTGGTLMGVGRALRAAFPAISVVAVEPEESAVMSGDCAGEHGILGIGDGFIPELISMDEVDEVARVSTDEAQAEAERLHGAHGYCVGLSAGANQIAARRLVDAGRRVVTLWPDCSDRYGTLGLEPPTAGVEIGAPECPLRARCAERAQSLL